MIDSDGIARIDTGEEVDVSGYPVFQSVQNHETIFTEINNGDTTYIAYFSPLRMNDWYVVVILDKADITRSVRSLLGQDVYILTTKIIEAVTLLCGGILFFLRKEGNQRERQLLEWADMDYLTGLYNRRSGTEQINGFLKQMKENTEQTHAFVILDLDNFKLLNDTLGHRIGDQALQEVAEILKQHFRDQDIICRLAGDEFVIFLKDIPVTAIYKVMENLLKKLCLTYSDGEKTVSIAASMGASLAPVQGTGVEELYQKADIALYQAKQNGKGKFYLYAEKHPC